MTLMERFAAKVDRRDLDECWPWLAAKNGQGYGKLWWGGRLHGAHRISKMLDDGLDTMPAGMEIDHLCENPPCVNPAHLEWVPREGRINSVRHQTRRLAGRTTCANGHPITPDSFYEYTYRDGRKYRACRACRNETAKRCKQATQQQGEPQHG